MNDVTTFAYIRSFTLSPQIATHYLEISEKNIAYDQYLVLNFSNFFRLNYTCYECTHLYFHSHSSWYIYLKGLLTT